MRPERRLPAQTLVLTAIVLEPKDDYEVKISTFY